MCARSQRKSSASSRTPRFFHSRATEIRDSFTCGPNSRHTHCGLSMSAYPSLMKRMVLNGSVCYLSAGKVLQRFRLCITRTSACPRLLPLSGAMHSRGIGLRSLIRPRYLLEALCRIRTVPPITFSLTIVQILSLLGRGIRSFNTRSQYRTGDFGCGGDVEPQKSISRRIMGER